MHRKRSLEFPHDRKREIPVVAIAVVEGETGKAPREIALAKSRVQFVHRDDVDVARVKMRKQRARKNSGATSRCRLGWNSPSRGGRTWCSVKMVPTPAKIGPRR